MVKFTNATSINLIRKYNRLKVKEEFWNNFKREKKTCIYKEIIKAMKLTYNIE